MAGQYSHKQFFRRVPYLQLFDYFKSKGIELNIDFSEHKEIESEVLFEAFIGFTPELQATIEAEFQDINAMACGNQIAITSSHWV